MAESFYRYTAELTFNSIDGAQKIDPLLIRHIVVEYLYLERQMPIVYLSVALTPDIYEAVAESENVSTFFLSLNCADANGTNALSGASFSGEFNYVVSTNEPAYDTPLAEGSKSPDANYRSITLALMATNLLNATRAEKDVNDGILVSGVFGEIDSDTLIGKVIDGFEKYNLTTIIKAPQHNNQFDELVIPPMNNRHEIMQFIFDKAPFYNTTFTYFMDFNNAYILDQDKEGCMVNDESGVETVLFDVKDVTHSTTYDEGAELGDGSCTIHLNPSHVNIYPNKVQDKVANNLVTVDEYGNLDAKELNVNAHVYSDPKYTFKRGGNAQLYKNILESNMVQVMVSKEGLDTSLFTPNKKYVFNNTETSGDYNGSYLLIEKRDIIRNNNGVMRASTEFTLRKIGEVADIGDTIAQPKNVRVHGGMGGSAKANVGGSVSTSSGGTALGAPAPRRTMNVVGVPKASSEERFKVEEPLESGGQEEPTGGIQFISDYDPSYEVTQPPVMNAPYGGVSGGDQVQELSEEEWRARTSIRGSASIIDISNAGATKFIIARGSQTLNKPLFK